MNNKIEKIINLIEKHDKIAFFHHIMIDGDSLTCSYGLLTALKKAYPNKEIKWIADPSAIKKRFPKMNIKYDDIIDSIDDSYLAIIGDCANAARIYGFDEYKKAGAKIVFDHHTNEVDFENDVFWHEPTWIASSIQATLIAEALPVELDEEIALNLVYGIITDSGRFAYSAADPLPLEVSARLFKHISNEKMSSLYQNMSKKTLKGLKFESWIYNKLKIEDHVGYVVISKQDQQELKMDADRVTRVNLIANIEGEDVWIFFIEYPDFIRVEFRSNGFPVNEVAKHFDGGGHIKASGCRLSSLDEVSKVVEYTKSQLMKSKN